MTSENLPSSKQKKKKKNAGLIASFDCKPLYLVGW